MASTPHPLRTLRGARILLGVTGGIAAYKAAELARLLVKAGAKVQVVMTEAATQFVGPATFAALTHNPVPTHTFDSPEDVLHVRLAREAELVIVAPATADVLAKMAHGLAPDMLTNALLVATCPVLVAPAMHTEMWEHPATRANLRTLAERGVVMVGPETGDLAGGDEGIGRMSEPQQIAEAAAAALTRDHDLAGLRFIVTAGGTQEPIDPVRFITNRSSGKMGYAIAAEAARRGAEVSLISGPSALPVPEGVVITRVTTVLQMREAVMKRFAEADVVVKAAAVADFRPKDPANNKMKKSGSLTIELELNPDILAELGATKTNQFLVGFAAETDDHLAGARKKLAQKHLDMIVLNPIGQPNAGFEVDTNHVSILGADGAEEELPVQPKTAIARILVDRIVTALEARTA